MIHGITSYVILSVKYTVEPIKMDIRMGRRGEFVGFQLIFGGWLLFKFVQGGLSSPPLPPVASIHALVVVVV